jgi:cardiolipin synthase
MSGAEWISVTLWGLHVVVGLIAAVAISVDRRPSSAIAWILLIIFVPLIGLVAFLLVGFGRLPRGRREKQSEVCALMLERAGVLAIAHTPATPN